MSIHDLIANSERSTGTIWLNKEGEHILSLVSFSTEDLRNAGKKMVGKFKVISSDGYPTGTEVAYTWDVYNNKPIWRDAEVKKVKTFLCELLGKDVGKDDIQAVEDGKHAGATVRAMGVVKAPRPRKDNPEVMTKEFTEIYFSSYTANGAAAEPKSVLGQLKK